MSLVVVSVLKHSCLFLDSEGLMAVDMLEDVPMDPIFHSETFEQEFRPNTVSQYSIPTVSHSHGESSKRRKSEKPQKIVHGKLRPI